MLHFLRIKRLKLFLKDGFMKRENILWPPNFKAAIFDFDGTIAHSADVWNEVDKIFLDKRGIEWTPEFAPKIAALGFVEGARYVIEEYGFNETVPEICDEWNYLASQLYSTQVSLRPGAIEYIEALKDKGIPVGLATTNNLDVLGSLRPRIDVWNIFDAVVLGDEVKKTKHFPDIYLEAARRLNTPPENCIVFEDIVPGINSAKKAGMIAVGLQTKDPTQNIDKMKKASDIFIEDWIHLI